MSLNTTNDINFASYSSSQSVTLTLEGNSTPVAFASLHERFNTALDSTCTNQIIRDRNLFQTYDVSGAVPVKTANCGFLTTLAIGDVKFCIVIKGTPIIWTLKSCLHAPDVPINLISVGALQEHHMSVTFAFQKTTIAFPNTHSTLAGLSFEAEVIRRLSLLYLNFIPATMSTPTIAFTMFQVPVNLFELWHCRFGHLGQDAI